MWDKLKSFGKKTKDAISSAAVHVSDLNGDGKVDEDDARIAAEWAKETATSVGNEVGRITKEALRSDMAKDAAAGAAIGAVVAIPIPVARNPRVVFGRASVQRDRPLVTLFASVIRDA